MSKQRPYYDIDFTIDGKSYAMNLQSIRFVSSIYAVFQSVFIRFRIDSQDVVNQKIYGQKPVKLIIREMTEDVQDKEQHEIELYTLLVLGGNTQKPSGEQQHMLSNKVTLICVPKKPWDAMTSVVNYLAQNTSPKSPFDVAQSLIDKFLPGVKKDVSNKNANTYKGEQLPVPPMNFATAINYLDDRYSIFKGPLFYQCRFEETTMCMWDLGQKLQDPEDYTVYALAHGKKEDPDIYEKSGADDKTFYTYSNIIFQTNSGMSIGGDNYTHRYIVKPSDGLYKMVEMTAGKLVEDKLLPIDNDGSMLIHDGLKDNNVRYHARSFVGVDMNPATMTSPLASKFHIQSEANFRLDRNLRLKRLFRVGMPMWLKSEVQEYQPYSGKYLVKGSVIDITKDSSSHFNAIADISICRSNILT